MSANLAPMNALLRGVVEYLRSTDGLGLGASECDEQAGGQPPPMAGQRYIAVTDTGSTNDATEHLDEQFGLTVTITFRTPYKPRDRELSVRQEIRAMANAVKLKLHGVYDPVMNTVNDLLASTQQGFCEPLRYLGTSEIMPKNPDWFWADAGTGDTQSGVAVTVRFGRARLVEDIHEGG